MLPPRGTARPPRRRPGGRCGGSPGGMAPPAASSARAASRGPSAAASGTRTCRPRNRPSRAPLAIRPSGPTYRPSPGLPPPERTSRPPGATTRRSSAPTFPPPTRSSTTSWRAPAAGEVLARVVDDRRRARDSHQGDVAGAADPGHGRPRARWRAARRTCRPRRTPPMTSTRCPAATPPRVRQRSAVVAARGSAAACSNDNPAGLGASTPCATAVYSAKVASASPSTSSPTCRP